MPAPYLADDPEPSGAPRVRIQVRVVPGARRDEVVGPHGDRLKVRVGAPPERGRANQAVGALLARSLARPIRDVALLRGSTARDKTFVVHGIDVPTVLRLLQG